MRASESSAVRGAVSAGFPSRRSASTPSIPTTSVGLECLPAMDYPMRGNVRGFPVRGDRRGHSGSGRRKRNLRSLLPTATVGVPGVSFGSFQGRSVPVSRGALPRRPAVARTVTEWTATPADWFAAQERPFPETSVLEAAVPVRAARERIAATPQRSAREQFARERVDQDGAAWEGAAQGRAAPRTPVPEEPFPERPASKVVMPEWATLERLALERSSQGTSDTRRWVPEMSAPVRPLPERSSFELSTLARSVSAMAVPGRPTLEVADPKRYALEASALARSVSTMAAPNSDVPSSGDPARMDSPRELPTGARRAGWFERILAWVDEQEKIWVAGWAEQGFDVGLGGQ